jgi:parallel beta-helix repeat protein
VCAEEVRVIRAADYGARPDDGQDDTPAIRLALEAARGGPSRVTFEKGTYDLYRDRAYEQYLFVSNNDEGLKRIAFPLIGFEDVEIDGQGALFLFRGWITPFYVSRSKNVTLRRFTVDWTRTFHSEGRIVENHDDGMTVQIDEHFPYEVRNGVLVFTDGKMNSEPLTTVKGSETLYPYGSLLEFDAVKRETAYMAHDFYGVGTGIAAQDAGERKVRLFKQGLKGTPGNILVFSPSHRDCCAIILSDMTNAVIREVTLHHCGGMGILAQRSSDILVEEVKVTPAPDGKRIISLTADATHFVNCSGKITLKNSLFENQKDDATNIHGLYVRVMKRLSDTELEVKLIHTQQYGFEVLTAGATVELVKGQSLVTYGKAVVKAVTPVNKEYTRVTFSDKLPEQTGESDVIACDGAYSETLITGCVIRNNRARGILLGSRARMVIENNTFHTPGAAILLEGDGRFWYEQAGVRDLVIRKNIFDNCNFGVWGKATIETGAGIEKECRATSRYNRNIVIEDNLFRTFGSGPLVQMYSVDGLTFVGNRLEKTRDYPAPEAKAGKIFMIADSDHVKVDEPKAVSTSESTTSSN